MLLGYLTKTFPKPPFAEMNLIKEKVNNRKTLLIVIYIDLNKKKTDTKFLDKWDSFLFEIVLMPFGNISKFSTILFFTIGSDIFRLS